jgi:hypothetical protein
MNAARWSKPFHGVQHFIDPSNARRWATVSDYRSFAMLSCNFEGCGFRPIRTRHENAELARAAGEAFIAQTQQVTA